MPSFDKIVDATSVLGFPVVCGLVLLVVLWVNTRDNKKSLDELHKKVDNFTVIQSQGFAGMQTLIQNNADRNFRELRKQSNYLRALVELNGNKRHAVVVNADEDAEPIGGEPG